MADGRVTGGTVIGDVAASLVTTDLIDVLDTVEVPIVIVRRDFVIAFFNKAAGNVIGLSPSDIGRRSRDVSVFAGLPQLETQCSQAIAAGLESRVDFRFGERWFVVRVSPYTKADREVAGVVLTFTNVTAFRTSIDQAIYEREFTKAILNTVANPLVVLSADQRIQSGNRAFYTMFGVSRDESQGVPLYDVANGTFGVPLVRTQLEDMLAGNKAFHAVEVDQVVPGNGHRTLILDARPLSLPGHFERRVLVTFQDITARKEAEAAKDLRTIAERKRSEEELRRSEAFLAEAQRLSLTGSFSWRIATDEFTCSAELHRIFAFQQDIPVTLALIGSRLHPEDIPLFNEMIERARSVRADFDYEFRLQMSDRSIKFLHVVAHATRDREGQLDYIGAVQDVTLRRLSEEALAKARSELAHATRVQSLGVLTASIAHEVNQPLATIVTNGETSLRWLARDEVDIERVRGLTKRIVADARRAAEIIERIRNMVSHGAPEQKLLSIEGVIHDSLGFLRDEFQSRGISVSLDLASELPQIVGDRTQLQQVVVNLAINAAQAMSQSGKARRSLLVQTRLSDPEMVCCTIEDSGPGIDPEHLPRLFDTFFTTKDTGMGMGLAICRSIVEAHGGRIGADNSSALGGARFSFTLPSNTASTS